MALTYYIRSWDPRSTYPANPQEGDICYTITLDQTWAPVGGVKKDNLVKEEVYQSGNWVEVGGGGGGGTGEAMILPAQTVTITGAPVAVTNLDFSELEDGDNVTMVVNTDVASGTYYAEHQMVRANGKTLVYQLGVNNGTDVFVVFDNQLIKAGTYTIACYKSAES